MKTLFAIALFGSMFAGCSTQIGMKPTVAFITPHDGESSYDSTIVSINATDDKHVSRVEIFVDGQIQTSLFTYPYHWIWNSSLLKDGSEYSLRAKAYDEDENTTETDKIYLTAHPFKPTNLTVHSLGEKEIALYWKDNCKFENGFVIERKVGNELFREVARVDADTTEWRDSTLDTTKVYTYRVRTFTDTKTSAYSEEEVVGFKNVVPQPLYAHVGAITQLAFSPRGTYLASAGDDNIIRVWNVHDGSLQLELRGNVFMPVSLSFSIDERTLMSTQMNGEVHEWHIPDGEFNERIFERKNKALVNTAVAFTSDKSIAITSDLDHTIKFLDPKSAQMWRMLRGHSEKVNVIALSPNEQYIASGSTDGVIYLWNLASYVGWKHKDFFSEKK